jgi:hypothetical protein
MTAGPVEAMTTHASGPGAGDWLAALVRGFHPLRWLVCLAGLAVAAGLHSAALPTLGPETDLRNASTGSLLWTALVLTAIATLWCLPAGWIARHELLARRRSDSSLVTGPAPQFAGATALLRSEWKSLLACCPFTFSVFLVLALPLRVVIGLSGLLGAPGALGMSLLLPVVLVWELCLLVVGLGVLAWPLMPVTVAAEWRDVFDAVSRGYSYLFQRPLRFLALTAVAVLLAWLPVRLLFALFATGLLADRPDLRLAVLFPVAALALSIFWSLETLVYLHLRASIDRTDAAELAPGPLPSDSHPRAEGPPARGASPTAAPSALGLAGALHGLVFSLVLIAGSWCLTVALFGRFSSGPTDWLDGGLTGWTAAPEAGPSWPYRIASGLAGLWAVLSLVFPVVLSVRRYLAARARQQAEPQPSAGFVPSARTAPPDESGT